MIWCTLATYYCPHRISLIAYHLHAHKLKAEWADSYTTCTRCPLMSYFYHLFKSLFSFALFFCCVVPFLIYCFVPCFFSRLLFIEAVLAMKWAELLLINTWMKYALDMFFAPPNMQKILLYECTILPLNCISEALRTLINFDFKCVSLVIPFANFLKVFSIKYKRYTLSSMW